MRGASRLVANNGKVAEPDEETLAALRGKHPEGTDPPPSTKEMPPLEVSEAIARTPAGGAAGTDGLRPEHLKLFAGPRTRAVREEFVAAQAVFCHLCADRAVPECVRPLFFGAELVAFQKKDGGLRPIAVGLALRRLLARAACASVCGRVAELLATVQLGVGVRGGAEAP